MASGSMARERALSDLYERLSARRRDLTEAVITRVYAIADVAEIGDPLYAEGLRQAVDAALDYGLLCLAGGRDRLPPVPPLLLVQAQLAAQYSVSLDTVPKPTSGSSTEKPGTCRSSVQKANFWRSSSPLVVLSCSSRKASLLTAKATSGSPILSTTDREVQRKRRTTHSDRLDR